MNAVDPAPRHPPTPLLGVLGGMGPLATIHFYRTLVTLTPAGSDQEHLPTVIWSDPTIPDRTRALIGGGRSPLPHLHRGMRHLENAGATAIAIPCNTAHAYVPALTVRADVPIIDMVRATVADCAARLPSGGVIGMLATRGTRYAALYDTAAQEVGLRVAYPNDGAQARLVDPAIAQVKSGGDLVEAGSLVAQAAQRLTDDGAGVVVGACTEIPVAAAAVPQPIPILDSMDSLAWACLRTLGRAPLGASR